MEASSIRVSTFSETQSSPPPRPRPRWTTSVEVIVRDDDGVERWSIDGVVCWAGIIIDDNLNARISVDGRISQIHDVRLEEFIAALDETEELIFATDWQGNPP
jgi:hypothetical protein